MDFSLLPRYLESPARQLFRRCVQCPDGIPSCTNLNCASDEVCSLNIGGCDACASAQCIKSATPPSSAPSSSGSSPGGAIAGGIIGGIALVAIIVGLVYWFYLRPKRQSWVVKQAEAEASKEADAAQNTAFIEERNKRASTHSVNTIKTTGSRASIPIAYIPGVTSRSDANSPEMIPPVPPIPAAGGSSMNGGALSPRLNTGTEMFFRPESTYTDAEFDRRSLAGKSTRSSVTSEFYNPAIVDPMPAHTAVAARATPISVASPRSQTSSPHRSPAATPPLLSHHNSIAGRMQSGPLTGQSGQARQIVITRSQSNLRAPPGSNMVTIAELDDTSTHTHTPRVFASELDDTSIGSRTPRLLIDRSGTASPSSMLSDDAEHLMRDGRWRRPSGAGPTGLKNHEASGNIQNTIRDATNMAYGSQVGSYAGSAPHSRNNSSAWQGYDSPFADSHATNMQ